jgi:NDMA-dependent alcohol dehydrogenase
VQTRGAILRKGSPHWDVETLDLDEPESGEILVRIAAAGLCHSDHHAVAGDIPRDYYPFCGGHEGSGVVEAVGPDVTRVRPGDHVVTSFIPSCGLCRWCTAGMQNLCDRGAAILKGTRPDGTMRMSLDGVGVAGGTPTFSQWSLMSERSLVAIPPDIDLTAASLLSCAVPTGWGAAVNGAQVEPGDIVIVIGVGGVGMNAVQGAWLAGAERVIAVDPVEFKRAKAPLFGATDVAATVAEAADLARSLTNGQGADAAILTVGLVRGPDITDALGAIAKGGTVVVTAVGPNRVLDVPLNIFEFAMYQKRIQAVLYGMCSPLRDVPRLVDLYRNKRLLLDELITTRYQLDDINIGYADLHAGLNIRGVIAME